MTHKKSKKWVDVLSDVVYNINNSYNSSIRMIPAKVKKDDESQIFHNLYGKYILQTPKTPKLQKGDLVKIANNKLTFSKGYEANFSDETFKVTDVKRLRPVPQYRLADLEGDPIDANFYEEELVKVANTNSYDE